MAKTKLTGGRRRSRSAGLLAAGAVLVAVGVGATGPVSAANTFSSEWADAAWSGQSGSSTTWQVTMAPGKDDYNGQVTKYLKTSITARFCSGGFNYEANLAKTEQAKNLAGVAVNTPNGQTAVARTTRIPGTLTKTPSSNCAPTGTPVSSQVNLDVTLKANWNDTGSATTYTGHDCGGTGNCTYKDAKAKGSVKFMGQTFDLGRTNDAWLWKGVWSL